MNSLKNIIKFIFFFTLLFLVVFLVRIIPEPKHDIHTSYSEWAKQIGLYSTKNVKVSCYDGENSISVGAECENGIIGYSELLNIIKAHNKFVDENQNYFPPDIKIMFNNEAGGEQPNTSFFFNTETNIDWFNDYIKQLERPSSLKIQYICIDMDFAHTEIKANTELEIDIPVIILQCHDNSYTPRGSIYEFLGEYKNAEDIILEYYQSPDFDKEEICKEIHAYLPDVEIYTAETDNGQHYLNKCQ